MKITATELRRNVHKILDRVISTGMPVEAVRKGRTVRMTSDVRPSRLARLKKRTGFVGDPDDILKMNWLSEWSGLR